MLKNKYLWIGIVFGLIVGDLVGVLIFKGEEKQISHEEVQATSTVPYVIVKNQLAGPIVTISDVNISTSTWFAVRESNGELLGRILGARRVDQSVSGDVLIELLRPTVSNLMYAVVMYVDNGDGVFDNKNDTLVQKDAEPILFPFATE